MSRVWLEVDDGQCLRTNYIRNFSMSFFAVTLWIGFIVPNL